MAAKGLFNAAKKINDLKVNKIVSTWKMKMEDGWQPASKWDFTGVDEETKDFLWTWWKNKNKKGIIW